jgi:hypothetical protein
MNWLAILKALVALLNFVSTRMIELGQKDALQQQMEILNDKIKKSAEARQRSVDDSKSGGLLNNDGYRRD